MKKLLISALMLTILFCGQLMQQINAAPVWNMPTIVIQPNGDTLHCFVTGDEYYQRIHDANNYTIVLDVNTGYYVYAMMEHGQLTPSKHIAGTIDPATIGIEPGLMISYPELMERRKRFDIPAQYKSQTAKAHSNHGVLNNIVIFVRFADDPEMTTNFSYIDGMYNDSTENAVSVFNYYQSATYHQLRILTHYYPVPEGEQIISYKDIYTRSYYNPYSAYNPDGYTEQNRASREFGLLERATRYIDSLNIIPDDLIIDEDRDGRIDNISYVVKGDVGGWNDLLWPHKWNLYDRNVYLKGKKVDGFNFILEGAGSHYFGTSTLCHEMFHTLGAPDLYHYYNYTNTSPVGYWDIMERNANPPQHMGAYMKFKYGRWITQIPTIEKQGTYSLRPLSDPRNENNCYKILTQNDNQYYVLEYRDNELLFETGLPDKGLLIYRIDTRFNGNADFDKLNYYDELYVFRPGGNDTVNGNNEEATFTAKSTRTKFDYSTDPCPTLTRNIPDSSFGIYNIRIEGDSIVFDYIDYTGCRMPINMNAHEITGSTTQLQWEGFSNSYRIEYGKADEEFTNIITTSDSNYQLTNLLKNRTYRWRIKGLCQNEDGTIADSSDMSDWMTFTTMPCHNTINTLIGDGNDQRNTVPLNARNGYSYVQQIYTADEMNHDSMSIAKVSFNLISETPMLEKNSCKIYLGHVNRSSFATSTDIVPIDSLQLVYEGPIRFYHGWNDIILDEQFDYNGTDNLLIAIDDNSGNFNHDALFHIDNTTEYTATGFYSNIYNPEPTQLNSFRGDSKRYQYRSQIRFLSCDPAGDDNIGIDRVDDCNVTIRTTQLNINLESTTAHTYQLYDVAGRLLDQKENQSSCTLQAPQGGVYLIRIDNATTKKVVVF